MLGVPAQGLLPRASNDLFSANGFLSHDVGASVRYEYKLSDTQLLTLKVNVRATKPEIKAAVEELFKVNVLAVNTMNVSGKYRRQRTAQAGQTADWKKAIVTLKEGDKISLT